MAKRRHEASYVLQKLRSAVDDLAMGEKPLRDRVWNVFESRLVVLQSEDFPPDLRDLWDSIERTVTATGDVDGRGSVRNTLDRLDEQEVQRVAEKCRQFAEPTRIGPRRTCMRKPILGSSETDQIRSGQST